MRHADDELSRENALSSRASVARVLLALPCDEVSPLADAVTRCEKWYAAHASQQLRMSRLRHLSTTRLALGIFCIVEGAGAGRHGAGTARRQM